MRVDSVRGAGTSDLRRLGLRAEKRPFGACLTMAAPARVIRQPDWNRLGNEVFRRLETNRRLRRWERLRAVFRD
jgi:hypothetical protein